MSWFNKLTLEIKIADLFEQPSDGIVCPVTTRLGAYGALSRQLFATAGEALTADISKVAAQLDNNRLNLGAAVLLEAGLKYHLPGIGYVILAALWDHENQYSANLIYQFFINGLRKAFENNLKSIALPILHVPLNMLAETMIRVIKDLDGLKISDQFSVEKIIILSLKEHDVTFIKDYLAAYLKHLIKE